MTSPRHLFVGEARECAMCGGSREAHLGVRLCLEMGCHRAKGHDGPHWGEPRTEEEELADYHESVIP